MRVPTASLCERQSVLTGVQLDGMRLDGRESQQWRDVQMQFGRRFGVCQVRWGGTRVLATVSATLGRPRASRPYEGSMQLLVDMSPTCAPGFCGGSGPADTAGLERLLERCLRESRCVDMESLCVRADEHVWQLCVRVCVLDQAGAVADAAALAAVAALHHFRRPHVQLSGTEVRVCRAEEVAPVPLALLHTPILLTYAFLHDGACMLADPSDVEERAVQGTLTLGVNSYRELCTLHVTGTLMLTRDQVLHCSQLAVTRARLVVADLKARLAADRVQRDQGNVPTLADVHLERLCTAATAVRIRVRPSVTSNGADDVSMESSLGLEDAVDAKLALFRDGTAVLADAADLEPGGGGVSCWFSDDEAQEPRRDDGDAAAAASHVKQEPVSGSDSEEEMKSVLRPEDLDSGFV